jgi:decaprenylphospho-beta-D-ribofuranose 2-oxidase
VTQSAARIRAPRDALDVEQVLAHSDRRGAIARGAACSYGDAAQNEHGTVLDCRSLAAAPVVLEDGILRVGAGVTLGTVLETIVPMGWMLPVLPATRHATVGGAIAADVHGKNHHRVGSLRRWLDSFTLVTPIGVLEVDAANDPDLFAATAGGMGLTGVVVEARLRLVRGETAWLMATQSPAHDLDALLAQMDEPNAAFTVAWIDAFASGPALGRGVVVTADPARRADVPDAEQARLRAVRWRRLARVPDGLTLPLARPMLSRRFNSVWFRRATRSSRSARATRFDAVLMPLDAVGGWNRLYGRRGFVQYQFVVPDSGVGFLRHALERLQRERCWSCFTTLKRLGPANDSPLSFPRAGWSLSLDIPAWSPGLSEVLDAMDDDLVAAGGRIYLAKDSRMRGGVIAAMYPSLGRLVAVRDRVDPGGVLQSDLARRLSLV